MDSLRGKSVIVTGGTAGIGRAIALAFASKGARVAIFGQNEKRGAEVVQEMQALNLNASPLFLTVDVSQKASVDLAVKKTLDAFQNVDILINNAGITRDQLLMKMSEEEWDQVFAVNMKSCYNMCHSLVRSMMKARQGSIINISSVVGLVGNAGQANYAAAKAAMIGFTKALAKELAPRQIRVNCICPGFIETAMTDALTEQKKQAVLQSIPLGRMGTPEDIAASALFLASESAQYITGQVLVVDGGMV